MILTVFQKAIESSISDSNGTLKTDLFQQCHGRVISETDKQMKIKPNCVLYEWRNFSICDRHITGQRAIQFS